jgi:allantoicase
MDGWETRRRREAGYDWCIIKLGNSSSQISGIEIDTAHFTGNNTPEISIEISSFKNFESLVMKLPNGMERLVQGGVQGTGHTPQEVAQAQEAADMVEWMDLLPRTPLSAGFENTRLHYYTPDTCLQGSIIKLNYFPDGGVARLKLWSKTEDFKPLSESKLYMPIETGKICTVVSHTSTTEEIPSKLPCNFTELSSQDLGGKGISCSNKHYGEPWRLTQRCISQRMDDGWETARHPSRPGVLVKNEVTNLIDSSLLDWCVLKLGKPALHGVNQVILDTRCFLGNYPESVMLEGCNEFGDGEYIKWFPLVERTRMSPDSEHLFEKSKDQLSHADKPVTHVRLSIFPDGGVSRVRVYG